MGQWRLTLEASLKPSDAPDLWQTRYSFGPPATAEQIAGAERDLGFCFPADVKELLLDSNGVWRWNRYSHSPERESSDIVYLDTASMSGDVPKYFRECEGNPLPPAELLRKVVFFAQSNGYADLYGVCVESFTYRRPKETIEYCNLNNIPIDPAIEFFAGEVVKLDHEIGEFEKHSPSLADFVRRGVV